MTTFSDKAVLTPTDKAKAKEAEPFSPEIQAERMRLLYEAAGKIARRMGSTILAANPGLDKEH